MGDAVILGYGAVPVGIYQRTKDGRDTPLEHELAVRVVLEAMRMAGLTRTTSTAWSWPIPATTPSRATSTLS